MKKLFFLLFLFIAGIVFSQENPLQEETPDAIEATHEAEEPEGGPENAPSSKDAVPSSETVKRPPFWAAVQDQTVAYEFPQWAKDLRRGEIIAFGAFPIMVFFSKMFIDLYRSATHGWDSNYAPWPFTGPNSVNLTTDQVKLMFGIAALASVVVSVTDHFIIRHKRKKAALLKAATHLTPPKRPETPADLEDQEDKDDQDNAAIDDGD